MPRPHPESIRFCLPWAKSVPEDGRLESPTEGYHLVQHIRNSHPRVADPRGTCARCSASSAKRIDGHRALKSRHPNMVQRLR